MRDRLADIAIRQAELGRLPDSWIRAGMRRVIRARLASERSRDPRSIREFWEKAWSGPIALSTDVANEQHYEVPPELFERVLGPREKYSSAYWPDGVEDLASAEEAMLELYATRARLEDGQSILDLGCGWGSFALWAAERYPESSVVGVSNSHAQAMRIKQLATERGLSNIEIVTADVNDFQPSRRFDRIVSIEMLEHVRNHRALFERMSGWVEEDGAIFTHVFAHQEHAYPFEIEGPATWMARTFFTGGIMPSRSLLPDAARPRFTTDSEWWVDGSHYARTLESWLKRLDGDRAGVHRIFEDVYGDEAEVWLQRWRMFFMACAEMFSYHNGTEWGVVQHLFRPRA